MSGIVTVTVKPSLDVTLRVGAMTPNRKLRYDDALIDPGGGGINVARALTVLGEPATAIWTRGPGFGDDVERRLDAEGLDHRPVPVEGQTTLSVTVIDDAGDHLRLSGHGAPPTEDEVEAVTEAIRELAPDWLVLSGGLPPEAPDDLHRRFAAVGRGLGAKVVVDTHGPPLDAVLGADVFLAKPNRRELAEFTGRSADELDVEDAAAAIREERGLEVLVVSLGADGAVAATPHGVERVPAPDVEAVSRVGAGDSMVAGLVAGLQDGDIGEALRLGVAAGSAALRTPGTQLCRAEDVEELLGRIPG
ncbi:MAG: 1-phosphofructokinase family hexose kinase [Acidimicrobiia bacterium]